MSEELLSLVMACKKGNEKAWEPFVKKCGRIIRGCLLERRYFGGKKEELDEVVQQVWIKLLRGGLKDFKGTTQYEFLRYLKTITVHEANTHFKRGSNPKNNDYDENVTAKPLPSPGPPDDEGQSGDDLGPKLDLEKEKARLRECLKELPPKHQEIAWKKAKGYKDSEIREIFGMPMGTVAVIYARIKKKLRDCMERT